MDAYNLRAKLSPALLVLLPLLFGLLSWAPDIRSQTDSLVGAAVSAGVVFILMHIARDAGKRAEKRLIGVWGGFLPSVLMLRHSDGSVDRVTKERYHAKLQNTVGKVRIPTPQEEADDQVAADEQYNSCCQFLLRNTRDDKQFPLLKEENMNYGFRRNLYGLRSYGVAFSVAGLILSATKLYQEFLSASSPSLLTLCLVGACVFSLLIWLFIVNENFVRAGADAYALRLLETIEDL